ncbi:preprotein translocase subunit SecG [Xylella taiwanensis]|uniref:Protein-export membrane protein SecG n=1 Tax=Xylella taiwanensis TaxID=1444770 RepID=Z9JKV2_9GAMM|nr:preprotein translocase subunit SecG [Xylella taiwanensis]AXI82724.1 preprotein translocase subunit SecG [Xylella taiwanensis]EWS78583.1 preprotein translocase subunit SecG [Xylella taiwanensis]MCD8455728.1 preprotein translocase subunit SecG [Xylella taiwanensis]MCD8458133.1 preprotein translocase subunit SecG [Xylella taiwanensis]MCD8460269.1 preprotein translocase subunit SecG [Xylella taiwanensis]
MLMLNVIYVLVAIAMIVLILMQRGTGAAAGSGFGTGASGTVFGARGASNFLSKSTKWLAVVFFGISLFMAWYAGHGHHSIGQQHSLMSEVSPTPAAGSGQVTPPVLQVPAAVPTAPTPAKTLAGDAEKASDHSQKH